MRAITVSEDFLRHFFSSSLFHLTLDSLLAVCFWNRYSISIMAAKHEANSPLSFIASVLT